MKQWIEKEEQALACFDRNCTYELWLQQYLQFSELRTGSRTFRHCLRWFIRWFRKERLLPGKALYLHLEKDGIFTVRCGQSGKRIPHLSETEQWVFRYLCFLQLHRFWAYMRKRARFPAIDPPICIRDFSSRLDESVDFAALLKKAKAISSRVTLACSE